MRHLVALSDLSSNEIEAILAIAADLKSKFQQGVREPLLPGRMMALVFEKQSLRTRVSFETCMTHLGGGSLMLGDDAGFGKRESIADFTRVLSAMVDVIVVRSKAHSTVEQVAEHATCPVVNGLTDLDHPCQALADLLTVREEFGGLEGKRITWVGDGNNVARSLAVGCAKTGAEFAIAAPEGYQFPKEFVGQLKADCPEALISETDDPHAAVNGAAAIYTDVWASMGQEAEEEQRKRDFADYQVNGRLMAAAPSDAIFLHCLPAKRGQEVTDEVIDSPQSRVVEQAANRMHAQKGVLAWLLGAKS
ncbi:Ornithine carbamoyltransferase [Posidoniimonas polymericola]|uniref:Ornithine carbamoyltransferase n=1 Tax=Posidoniimonas polymericola TaxID=2528002 RepID=A0A5C5YID7_9BACT|nr:ornithine carbamoyltransferase [Posidoniimonas polymericola]TWT74638.1 Ornithine carbamoyltransferase [Posidoniimonas polymericola]